MCKTWVAAVGASALGFNAVGEHARPRRGEVVLAAAV